ncbi:HTH domain-containing protein [uncultured Tateyamaria sp.]|uniref:helix-turn-helix transcriptional regulator n=1 Tax=Tateyamaria sp. 1078 TaxID=3417464 RepID=UPI002605C4A0|nr:HTH domain-containing protein [uncultured Tateyamaria sp.]
MRAARLLQILLLLQNRGRQTSGQLAAELEVAQRTILRDVDAMTEAGLPIIVHQGNRGGIELGFNYRTRLTGLARDEAEALGLILSADSPMISALGLGHAANRARAKLVESLPDKTRMIVKDRMAQFTQTPPAPVDDARVLAVSRAVRARTIIRLRFASPAEQVIHPVGLHLDGATWHVQDARAGCRIAMADWGRINVSAKRFSVPDG